MSREATKAVYELMDMGMVSAEQVVDMCMKAMSEDDVKWMLDANELSPRFFEDEDDGC